MENNAVQIISNAQLAIAFVPVLVVLSVFYLWSYRYTTVAYAFVRMTVQLILVGYVLTYLFGAEHSLIVVAVLLLMVLVSSYITLRPLENISWSIYTKALLSIAIAGTISLLVGTQLVIGVDPWFEPRYMIPLGGMMYANAMNTVSLAAERYESNIAGLGYYKARNDALNVSMIPTINMLLATGLVALPGIMTGQVLSGVSPLIAVRYQIVIMCIIFAGSAGATLIYLYLLKPSSGRNV